jgi:hypothetical protein
MGVSCEAEGLIVCSINIPPFVELDYLISYTKRLVAAPFPEPVESNLHCYTIHFKINLNSYTTFSFTTEMISLIQVSPSPTVITVRLSWSTVGRKSKRKGEVIISYNIRDRRIEAYCSSILVKLMIQRNMFHKTLKNKSFTICRTQLPFYLETATCFGRL